MISDRILLKTVVRAWIMKGIATRQTADNMADELAYSVASVSSSDETLKAFADVVEEVSLEMAAEIRGDAEPLYNDPNSVPDPKAKVFTSDNYD